MQATQPRWPERMTVRMSLALLPLGLTLRMTDANLLSWLRSVGLAGVVLLGTQPDGGP